MSIFRDWKILQEVNVDLEKMTQGNLPPSGKLHEKRLRAQRVEDNLRQFNVWPDSFDRLIAGIFVDKQLEEKLKELLARQALQDDPQVAAQTKLQLFLYTLRNAGIWQEKQATPDWGTLLINPATKYIARCARSAFEDQFLSKKPFTVSQKTVDNILQYGVNILGDATAPLIVSQLGPMANILATKAITIPAVDTTADTGGEPSTPSGRRVRVGITAKKSKDDVSDDDILPIEQTLQPNHAYLLRVDISAEQGGSNVVNPVAIAEEVLERISTGKQIFVSVTSPDVNVEQQGDLSGWQAISLEESGASNFAYVRFTTRECKGLVRLNVNIYFQSILLQQLVCEARVQGDGDRLDSNVTLQTWAAEAKKYQELVSQLTEQKPYSLIAFASLDNHQLNALGENPNLAIEDLESLRTDLRRLLGVRKPAELAQDPTPRPLGNETTVLYAITPTFVAFDKYEDPALTLSFTEPPSAIAIKEKSGAEYGSTFNLKPRIAAQGFRELMQRAVTSTGDKYGFDESDPAAQELHDLLLELAKMGNGFFSATFNDDGVGDKVKRCLSSPAVISIARARSHQAPVPWNAYYSLPLIEDWEAKLQGKELTACMKWRDVSHQKKMDAGINQPQHALDYATCSGQHDCPHRRILDEVDGDYENRIDSTVCVFGFWGFKHQVVTPPGDVIGLNSDSNAAAELEGVFELDMDNEPRSESAAEQQLQTQMDLPNEIQFADHPFVKVLTNSTINGADFHEKNLLELETLPLAPTIDTANSYVPIKKHLCDRNSHVVYFYCHGGGTEAHPDVRVGNDNVRISDRTLNKWKISWQHSPLVVINGCQTVVEFENSIASLVLAFRGRNASGIIGTETTVFAPSAQWIGENIMRQFLYGRRVGEIMQTLRLELLSKNSLLGLVYSTYSVGELRLVPLHSPGDSNVKAAP